MVEKIIGKGKLMWLRVSELVIEPSAQRRLKEHRVVKWAAEFDPDLLGIIVVSHRDGRYYVMDGQHRIAVLRRIGYDSQLVQCEVFEALDIPHEAKMFIKRQERTAVEPIDDYRIRLTAQEPMQVSIDQTLTDLGLAVSLDKKNGHMRSVNALYYVYNGAGRTNGRPTPELLGKTLATLKNAWGNEPASFEGKLIEGLGMFYAHYRNQIDQKSLYEKLSSAAGGPSGIMGRARGVRDLKGRQLNHCVAAVIADTYNRKRHGKTKLPDWWR